MKTAFHVLFKHLPKQILVLKRISLSVIVSTQLSYLPSAIPKISNRTHRYFFSHPDLHVYVYTTE